MLYKKDLHFLNQICLILEKKDSLNQNSNSVVPFVNKEFMRLQL